MPTGDVFVPQVKRLTDLLMRQSSSEVLLVRQNDQTCSGQLDQINASQLELDSC